MVSRQERRRNERLKTKQSPNEWKSNSNWKCVFDNQPCCRSPSPLDGDHECGGITYWSSDKGAKETELIPPCERMKCFSMKSI